MADLWDELQSRANQEQRPVGVLCVAYPDGRTFNIEFAAHDVSSEAADRRVWEPLRRVCAEAMKVPV